jgi:hypothetical protein
MTFFACHHLGSFAAPPPSSASGGDPSASPGFSRGKDGDGGLQGAREPRMIARMPQFARLFADLRRNRIPVWPAGDRQSSIAALQMGGIIWLG